jgi:hypothetical protein
MDKENRDATLTTKNSGDDGEMMKMLAGGNSEPVLSLQDRFARFKTERKRERKLSKLVSTALVVRDELFMSDLRQKFLLGIRSYIGIPYHARYHGPESPYYNAPLYLDCCGLIRRVLQDLQSDFGFRVGRWNQNYLFDTLSESFDSIDQLQPGDLIFVEGTYFNLKSRRQKYDIVHVEIFIGGEQTIGARAQNGVVSVHDSYEYTSTKYEITKVYFRSLGPWLRGEFIPRHPEHWAQRDANCAGDVGFSSRLSVFDEGESGDELN